MSLSTQTPNKSSASAQEQDNGSRSGAVIGAVTVFIGIAGFFGLIWFGL